ncbi:glycosyltransferase family 2 protein [Oryzomonas sagensis]|uniref:Glycosyltransferase family 2 protein n=1 Tax=Oryzomonas sagensis TaxID=2603857 RepID=A0ABQ6TNX0_9BACT|nr:glycosyltransferase family 2 protein [Oryzomonas sagensis]KAB0669813.1 glycosyltransferase family 2 protein [Oryzomonas sagensis]
MAVCILIPAFNAEKTLAAILEECSCLGYPLVVVDDGSADATASIAAGYGALLLRHNRNRGKGRALRTGFAWALEHDCDAVVTLDADGQHDVSSIPRLVAAFRNGGFDILIASRFSQFQEMGGLRKVWNRFGVWCMRQRTGFEISDSQSGFRCYSGRLLRSVALAADGYNLEMEILMKAWRSGFSIGSLAVPARVADGRATSHFRPVRDTWNICMTFLRYM